MAQATTRDWSTMSVEALEEAVERHNRLYWVEDAPEISDPEFDRLVEALRRKKPDSPVLAAIGPAGAGIDLSDHTDGEKVTHDPPMLSLDKCYDQETLHKWFDKFAGGCIASPKIDGVAVSLRYDGNGRLMLAATRGNGVTGEKITENVLRIVDLPRTIERTGLEVRGEAYMPLSVFESTFKEEYQSPRNLTAGALKLKNPEQTADYRIHFFAYDVLGTEFASETDKMVCLEELGFSTVDWEYVEHDKLQRAFEDISMLRKTADYEMDGVVYRVNDVAEQRRMGSTSHHPRFAIAYKFQGDAGESVLRDVHWSVSRTGAINPIGIVDPVELSGAVVTRASLHNLAIMEAVGGEEGLTKNSRVLMMRRGGVIPHLEEVIEPGDEPIAIPETCPDCGAPTYRQRDVLCADHLDDCRTARLKQLEHFVSEIELKGIGPKILEGLYDAGLVSEPVDFFSLTLEELCSLDRMGETLARKLLDRIEGCRTLDVDVFLRALGIPELGQHVARLLAERYDSLDAILAVEPAELAEIPGIGEVIAEYVTGGFARHADQIGRLREVLDFRFPTPPEATADPDSPLFGKKVLFTGAMESMSRGEAKERVDAVGGQTPSSVTRDLDYLVIGDADLARFEDGWRTSKLKKAERYQQDGQPLQIIGESQFLELLRASEARNA